MNKSAEESESLDDFFCEERSYSDPEVKLFWETLSEEIAPIIRENARGRMRSLAFAHKIVVA
ncbi:MAG: hypothetical protein ABIH48_00310 [Candidatus Falkowbacteria bacterium]